MLDRRSLAKLAIPSVGKILDTKQTFLSTELAMAVCSSDTHGAPLDISLAVNVSVFKRTIEGALTAA